MWILIAFIAVPIIEIALFIQIGGFLGLFPTLTVVVLTAIAGTYLVRAQGLSVLSQLQSRFREMNDPSEPLAHGAMILFSGALLLTPGFFTDFVGFLLLIPNVRAAVFQKVKERINIQKADFKSSFSSAQNVYEGEYEPVSNPENSPFIKKVEAYDADAYKFYLEAKYKQLSEAKPELFSGAFAVMDDGVGFYNGGQNSSFLGARRCRGLFGRMPFKVRS